jgi:hypothetical protein
MRYNFSNIAKYPDGTWPPIGRAKLTYKFCPCRNQYFFKEGNNELLLYLRGHCKGWSENPEGVYTVNYIITVLFANWERKGLIRHNLYLLIGEQEVKAFGHYKRWNLFPETFRSSSKAICMGLFNLRIFITTFYLNTFGVADDYAVPFLCYENKNLLCQILKVRSLPRGLCYDNCLIKRRWYTSWETMYR